MFLEDLPKSCPPATATEPNNLTVYRLVKTKEPSIDDFHSYAKIGLDTPATADECRWASCSVFDSIESITSMKKLPKFKKHSLVSLTLTSSAGKVLKGRNGHYDWWIYKDFNPLVGCALIA
jgi:hypothetical protein